MNYEREKHNCCCYSVNYFRKRKCEHSAVAGISNTFRWVRTPSTHTNNSSKKKLFDDYRKTFPLHACFHFYVIVLIPDIFFILSNLFGFREAAVFVPFKHSLSSMGTSTLTKNTRSILRCDRINEQTERKQSNFKINYLLSTLAMTITKQGRKKRRNK